MEAKDFIVVGTSTLGFNLLGKGLDFLLKYNKNYLKMNQESRTRWLSYLLSFFHSLGVSVYSFYSVYDYYFKKKKINKEEEVEVENYQSRDLLIVMLGYFINDFIITRSTWMSHKSDLLHHFLAISLCSCGCFYIKGKKIAKKITNFTTTEFSTIFLDLVWMSQQMKLDTNITNILLMSFLLSFILTRNIGLPITIYQLNTKYKEEFKEVHITVRLSVYLLAILQYYWLFKLFKKIKRTVFK
eukprot:TRINITY_DN3598_c0_g1_i1.p1 TRINITY_DN3598_c0_g1~~TRINITY_DN3598_c0_g1_i1.p1  ORF type:complete len:242 (+),score=48.02 TRINITY_DN3598_c0_g1_i1:104-829(+)